MSEYTDLYVLYSLWTPGKRWRWGKFPDDWEWRGTSDMMREDKQIEERFSGPEESLSQMLLYLNKIFRNLKTRDVVKKFKITNTRSIPDDGKDGLPRGLPP